MFCAVNAADADDVDDDDAGLLNRSSPLNASCFTHFTCLASKRAGEIKRGLKITPFFTGSSSLIEMHVSVGMREREIMMSREAKDRERKKQCLSAKTKVKMKDTQINIERALVKFDLAERTIDVCTDDKIRYLIITYIRIECKKSIFTNRGEDKHNQPRGKCNLPKVVP